MGVLRIVLLLLAAKHSGLSVGVVFAAGRTTLTKIFFKKPAVTAVFLFLEIDMSLYRWFLLRTVFVYIWQKRKKTNKT